MLTLKPHVLSAQTVAVGAASLLSGIMTPVDAQAPPAAAATQSAPPRTPQGTPDLSGYWELRFDSAYVPKARLSAKLTPARIAAQTKKDAHAMRWCNWLGAPFSMT